MNWKSYSFGCLSSFVFLLIILASATFLIFSGFSHLQGKQEKVQDNTYLLLDLNSEIIDYRWASSPFWEKESPLALNILRQKLNSAAQDPKVAGVILKISSLSPLGYSQADALAHLLQTFKKQSDKKVFAYIYSCTDSKLLLASCADEIYLCPSAAAGISLLGINAKKLYLKSFLQKIGLDVSVVRTGDYKTYGETFSRDSISQEGIAEAKKVYGSFFALSQKQIANNLSLPLAQVKSLYSSTSTLTLSGEAALKLVDSLAYYQQFLTAKKIKNSLDIRSYTPEPLQKETKNKIAVVHLQGAIVFDADEFEQKIDLESTREIFEQIEQDADIKAVVLSIKSPGGSALASHLIADQVIKKCPLPVVIAMNTVAASGGYYLASAGDYIVASPYTITGSIGVCALLSSAQGLSQKLGINYSGVSYGEFATSFDISKPQSPALISAVRSHIAKVYQEFCYFVAKGRNLPLPKVKNLAQGKIYTAEQAKALHLIDQVGYLDDALTKAKELAKIEQANIVYYPRETDWFKSLLHTKLKNFPLLKVFLDADKSWQSQDYIQARVW